MKRPFFEYEAPRIEIMELTLEKGIAYTITQGDGSEIDDLEPGDGWGNY